MNQFEDPTNNDYRALLRQFRNPDSAADMKRAALAIADLWTEHAPVTSPGGPLVRWHYLEHARQWLDIADHIQADDEDAE